MQKVFREEQGKKTGSKIFAIISLIIVMCAVVGCGGSNAVKEGFSEDSIVYDSYNHTLFNYKGDVIECEAPYYAQYSGIGTTVTLADKNDNSLYFIDGKMKQKLIAENVRSNWVSYDGSHVAYIQGDDGNTEGTLYLYDLKSGKSHLISSDVYFDYLCISSDGKAVAYIKNYNGDDDMELYVSGIKVKENQIDTMDSYPVAVAGDGKSLYYVNFDGILTFNNGKESISFDAYIYKDILFNNSATEMIYATEEEDTYYFNPEMKEPKKILDNEYTGIMVKDNLFDYYNSQYVCVLNKDTLKSSYIKSKEGIYWIDEEGEVVQVSTDSHRCKEVIKDNSLLFLEDGKLYKLDKPGQNTEASLLYDGEPLNWFVASNDLSKIYLVTKEYKLLSYKGNNETELISEGMESYAGNIAYNNAMGKVYFIENGDLYYAGENAQSIVKVCEEAFFLSECLDGVRYHVGEGNYVVKDLYYMDGKKTILLNSK